MSPRQFRRQKKTAQDKALSVTVRKHLSADALIRTVRSSFEQVGETRKAKAQIPMEDALMAAFAMFSLKDSSMLDFDRRRVKQPTNLKTVYKLTTIPCDTQMRTILDPVTSHLKSFFQSNASRKPAPTERSPIICKCSGRPSFIQNARKSFRSSRRSFPGKTAPPKMIVK